MPLDSPYSTKARTFGVIFPCLSRPVTESSAVSSEKTIRISERNGGEKSEGRHGSRPWFPCGLTCGQEGQGGDQCLFVLCVWRGRRSTCSGVLHPHPKSQTQVQVGSSSLTPASRFHVSACVVPTGY